MKFSDDLGINDRLSAQFSELLKDIEEGRGKLTLSQKITALTAIDRHIERRMRKEAQDDDAGSAVRQAAAAFASNAAGQRGQHRRANGKTGNTGTRARSRTPTAS
jgi:hypothetical protein